MQKSLAPVVSEYVLVLKEVVERNKIVMLVADVFFVDGTAFLLSLLRQIKFITAGYIATRTAKSLSKYLTQIVQVYARAGFTVHTILMDAEFEKVKDKLPSLICNTTVLRSTLARVRGGSGGAHTDYATEL